ncbi:MAG: cyclase family protein [Thermoplasmata archaeon]|nr:cyclase family protein [Thermoplasmata archaeon]
MPIQPGMPVLPGDPPVEVRTERSLARGDPFGLSGLTLGSHTGTHVDPPSHFVRGGASVDEIELGTLNGPCFVLHVPDERRVIGPEDLAAVPNRTERLLLRTSTSSRWATGAPYSADYAALRADAVERIAELGVKLLGVDALSVDASGSTGFPVHRKLLGSGVVLLEGLCLDGVAQGSYRLGCLPIRLARGDGAPARAVLCDE